MGLSDEKQGAIKITQILREMAHEGKFPVAVLTDRDGFPIASGQDADQDADRQSAVVALVQRTALQAQSQLGMAETDEFSLYDAEGKRLVCRLFIAGGYAMILAIIVPDKEHPYRRSTTRAIHAIQGLLAG
jgi:predicted regulator of Ras-like GTPase activity (Roadblock/LC7/MglB family)